jgi:arylsulfatase A-like enzyme
MNMKPWKRAAGIVGLAALVLPALSCRERTERKIYHFADSSGWRRLAVPDNSQAFAALKVPKQGISWQAPRSGSFELRVRLLLHCKAGQPRTDLVVLSGGNTLHRQELRKFTVLPSKKSRPAFLGPKVRVPMRLQRNERIELQLQNTSPGTSAYLVSSYVRAGAEGKRSDRPNVILISIDTLRADYVDPYRRLLNRNREFPPLSPNLDALAGQSTLYLDAQTVKSATFPALASLFTSLYPFQHLVLQNGIPFPEKGTSLVKTLFDNGYTTLAMNSTAYSLRMSGFQRSVNTRHKDKVLQARVLKELGAIAADAPFFLWVHFLGVHAGYTPPEDILRRIEPAPLGQGIKAKNPWLCRITSGELQAGPDDIRHIRNCYAGELLQVDAWLGEIFARLKEQGLWEDSLVMVFSDHGEDLFQHHRYFYHHPSSYQTSLHIPLLVKAPGQKQGAVSRRPTSILDIAPTILEMLGIAVPGHYQGAALKREFPKGRPLFAESGENSEILTMKSGAMTLVANQEEVEIRTPCGSPYPIRKYEMYDLRRDPFEQQDLASRDAAARGRLQARLFQFIRELKYNQRLKVDFDPAKLPPEMVRELKTLGYL